MKKLLFSLTLLGTLVLPVACNRNTDSDVKSNSDIKSDMQKEEDDSMMDSDTRMMNDKDMQKEEEDRSSTLDSDMKMDESTKDVPDADDSYRQRQEDRIDSTPIGGASEGPSNRAGEDAIEVEETEE